MTAQEMAALIVEKAKQNGLDNNLFFVATFSDYQKKRQHIKLLAEKIDMQGISVNGQPNPLLKAYDNATQSTAVLAEKLMNMLGEKPVKKQKQEAEQIDESKENKMPDFEMLPPAKLKAWCKKFDIDPDDYSKRFLFKALEKRWKFEYED